MSGWQGGGSDRVWHLYDTQTVVSFPDTDEKGYMKTEEEMEASLWRGTAGLWETKTDEYNEQIRVVKEVGELGSENISQIFDSL